MLNYAIIETLNGSYILKELSKVKLTDCIEIELYGKDIKDIKQQFNKHIKELK